MTTVTVYSRRGCHLCDELLEVLEPRLRGRAALEVVDIDTDETLRARYNTSVPVVTVGETLVSRHFLDIARLEDVLGAGD